MNIPAYTDCQWRYRLQPVLLVLLAVYFSGSARSTEPASELDRQAIYCVGLIHNDTRPERMIKPEISGPGTKSTAEPKDPDIELRLEPYKKYLSPRFKFLELEELLYERDRGMADAKTVRERSLVCAEACSSVERKARMACYGHCMSEETATARSAICHQLDWLPN